MHFLVGSDVITESLIRQRQDRGEGKVKVEVRDWRVVRKGSGAKDAGEYDLQKPKEAKKWSLPQASERNQPCRQFDISLETPIVDFCVLFFQYIFFPRCGPFLKSLLNLLQYCFCFMFFWPRDLWDLRSVIRDRTLTPCLGIQSFKHWTTRKDSICVVLNP